MAVTTPTGAVKAAGDRSSNAVYRELRITNILLAQILQVLQQMCGPVIYNPGISPDPDVDSLRNDPSFGA